MNVEPLESRPLAFDPDRPGKLVIFGDDATMAVRLAWYEPTLRIENTTFAVAATKVFPKGSKGVQVENKDTERRLDVAVFQ